MTTSVSSARVQRGSEAGSSNAYSATAQWPLHSTRSPWTEAIRSAPEMNPSVPMVPDDDRKYLSGIRHLPSGAAPRTTRPPRLHPRDIDADKSAGPNHKVFPDDYTTGRKSLHLRPMDRH